MSRGRAFAMLVLGCAACARSPDPQLRAGTPSAPATPTVARGAPDGTGDSDAEPAAAASSQDAEPPMPALPFPSYESLCQAPPDASVGSAPAPSADAGPATSVTFRAALDRRARSSSLDSPGFTAWVLSPPLKLRRQVFHLGAGGDPFQCCAQATSDALGFECSFSGVDLITSKGEARREGDELVVRWCTANLSTKAVIDRGEDRTALPQGSRIRFDAPSPACVPPSLP